MVYSKQRVNFVISLINLLKCLISLSNSFSSYCLTINFIPFLGKSKAQLELNRARLLSGKRFVFLLSQIQSEKILWNLLYIWDADLKTCLSINLLLEGQVAQADYSPCTTKEWTEPGCISKAFCFLCSSWYFLQAICSILSHEPPYFDLKPMFPAPKIHQQGNHIEVFPTSSLVPVWAARVCSIEEDLLPAPCPATLRVRVFEGRK